MKNIKIYKVFRSKVLYFGLLVIALIFVKNFSFTNNLVVNEVSFMNNDKNDWIEIYNPTLNNLSLKGYYLSDSKNEYKKFKITSDVVIQSGGFVVFYGENSDGEGEDIKLNFNISNGETVYLTSPNETVVDSLTVIMNEDVNDIFSMGRFPDGSEDVFKFRTTTPSEENVKDKERVWIKRN